MKWEPTGAEMMKALLMVICDEERPTDCLFWHGSPTDSRLQNQSAAATIANLYKVGGTRNIIVNGLNEKTCREKDFPYPGYEIFMNELAAVSVQRKDIIVMPPALHTAAESENLLRLMKERGWKSVTITSAPQHQLRCFLQIIDSMKRLGIYVRAYNRTSQKVSWREPLKKTVLGGGEIGGTLIDHVQAEYDRIVKYADPTGTGYSMNATIPEMFEYLKAREEM